MGRPAWHDGEVRGANFSQGRSPNPRDVFVRSFGDAKFWHRLGRAEFLATSDSARGSARLGRGKISHTHPDDRCFWRRHWKNIGSGRGWQPQGEQGGAVSRPVSTRRKQQRDGRIPRTFAKG